MLAFTFVELGLHRLELALHRFHVCSLLCNVLEVAEPVELGLACSAALGCFRSALIVFVIVFFFFVFVLIIELIVEASRLIFLF